MKKTSIYLSILLYIYIYIYFFFGSHLATSANTACMAGVDCLGNQCSQIHKQGCIDVTQVSTARDAFTSSGSQQPQWFIHSPVTSTRTSTLRCLFSKENGCILWIPTLSAHGHTAVVQSWAGICRHSDRDCDQAPCYNTPGASLP